MCQLPVGSRSAHLAISRVITLAAAIASDNTDLDCWTWFTHRFRWVVTKRNILECVFCFVVSRFAVVLNVVGLQPVMSFLEIDNRILDMSHPRGWLMSCAFEVTNPVLFFQSMHIIKWGGGGGRIDDTPGDRSPGVYRETKWQCHDRGDGRPISVTIKTTKFRWRVDERNDMTTIVLTRRKTAMVAGRC